MTDFYAHAVKIVTMTKMIYTTWFPATADISFLIVC